MQCSNEKRYTMRAVSEKCAQIVQFFYYSRVILTAAMCQPASYGAEPEKLWKYVCRGKNCDKIYINIAKSHFFAVQLQMLALFAKNTQQKNAQ